MPDQLKLALSQGGLRPLDYYFAQQLRAIDDAADEHIELLACLTSATLGQGNVCLNVAVVAGSVFPLNDDNSSRVSVPPWLDLHSSIEACSVIGKPGDQAPMLLDEDGRLYLQRYWEYEKRVAENCRARALEFALDELDLAVLQRSLSRMFPRVEEHAEEHADYNTIDWQRVAAATAVLKRLSVISGGPGTGKTHTVTSILALLQEQHLASDKTDALSIALSAPTGKAAARLTESIRKAKPNIACSEPIRERIPEQALTIHRLLGIRPGGQPAKFNADHPLPYDVVVIDEASMIDLPLMASLLDAIKPQARIILLGDKDQLASVEAGSVFADLSGGTAVSQFSQSFSEQLEAVSGDGLTPSIESPGFADSIVQLQKSYRFDGDSAIGRLAKAINAGHSTAALELFSQGLTGISRVAVTQGQLNRFIDDVVIPMYRACFLAESLHAAIDAFNRFRILCALRKGPMGVETINQMVAARLKHFGLIHDEHANYVGRPILITRNDYQLGLFNGDTGILWPDDSEQQELRAWFVMPDNSTRDVSPNRLPEHETAYAMTVHKSQGSEFEQVLMVLPEESSAVLTRELLYTGVTRAKREVAIWGSENRLAECIERPVTRSSGLYDKLYR